MVKVRRRCEEEAQWLLPVATAVMGLTETRVEIRRMWVKLAAVLRFVMTGPANRTRASMFTKCRHAGGHEEMMAFITQSPVERAATAHFQTSGADELSP